MKIKTIGLFSLMLILVFSACGNRTQPAEITESQKIIKTYPFSGPDPVPILTRSSLWGKGARLYPYTFFDKFSRSGLDKKWKVIRMQNPYIEVSLLPEVGGKIWGAKDRASNQSFIYTNHVLKFREIALRGPWTSGGIEFNFGIVGHTPSGAHPVDYLTRENPDGSVSCFVGSMDLPSRTHWRVEIRVPPDKAYFETRAFWYNPTPLHQSYYAWMNGAVRTGDDLQYIFPGKYHIAHNFAEPLRPWPVNSEGRDLSFYRNNDFGSYKSYFTVGEYTEFFGGYWHDSHFGFGHWARYDDMPGRKIWIWGLSRQGMIWEDLLTDDDGQYSEPQAGRYLNQNDHAFFAPHSGDRWREIWFPYKDIGPMAAASPQAVLNAYQEEGHWVAALYALQNIDEELIVECEGQVIKIIPIQLSPMETARYTLAETESGQPVTFRLGSGLTYTSDPEADDLQRPLHFHDFQGGSAETLFRKAERLAEERNYYHALEYYNQVLEKEPLHAEALTRTAELYFRRGEYDKTLHYAGKALRQLMYHPGANYIYGLACRRTGNMIDAKETMGWAARSLNYRSAAYTQLAEIFMTEGRLDRSLEYADQALQFNLNNLKAFHVKALGLRSLGQIKKARQTLQQMLDLDPLNHAARYELSCLDPEQENLEAFQSLIRTELAHETYLELACSYHQLNQNDDAVRLLDMIKDNPIAGLWKAYLIRSENPELSRQFLNEACRLSPSLIFPHREETIPVLSWAIEQNPEGWMLRYYLALIYWSKGRTQEAGDLLKSCRQPEFPPFYAARAYFYEDASPEKARMDYETAVDMDPDSWRNAVRLMDFFLRQNMADAALSFGEKAVNRFPDSTPVRLRWVGALMEAEKYQEAVDILTQIHALPSEGATAVREMYSSACLRLAIQLYHSQKIDTALHYLEKSKEFPENLGTGRPYDPDYRLQDFIAARFYEKLNQPAEANIYFERIRDYTLKHWPEKKQYPYIGGLVLNKFGYREKAAFLMKGQIPPEEIEKLQ